MMIELKNVSKTYGQRHIIKNLSYQIPEKSVCAIIGPSGSGKSTLLNMIGLLEEVDQGQILINQQVLPHINSSHATKLRRTTINYLFQSYALINNITVYDNLKIAMTYTDLSNKEQNAQIDKVLDKLQLLAVKDAVVNTLSGGEQQRVALARCILKPGDIVLADEPTGSLDDELSQIVFQEILNLRDDYGKTIIFVTHDLRLSAQADMIIQL